MVGFGYEAGIMGWGNAAYLLPEETRIMYAVPKTKKLIANPRDVFFNSGLMYDDVIANPRDVFSIVASCMTMVLTRNRR